jgi:hypothetical protein
VYRVSCVHLLLEKVTLLNFIYKYLKVIFFLRSVSNVDISFCKRWKRCMIIVSIAIASAIAIPIAIALTLGGGQQGTK